MQMYSFQSNIQKLLPKPAMENKVGSGATASYDDFEPYCNWRREEGSETLVIHVPEFKREQMKVHINSFGVLRVTGERQVDGQKWNRFCKEIKIPSSCNANEIKAKFSCGLLNIVMPKKIASLTKQDQPKPVNQSEESQMPKLESSQGQVTKMPTINERGGVSDNVASAGVMLGGAEAAENKSGAFAVPKLKMGRKVATGIVAVVVAVVLVLGACITHKYRSSDVEVEISQPLNL